jgi:hypothetical protein
VNDGNGNYGRKGQAAVIVAAEKVPAEKVPGLFFAVRIAMAADE